MSFIVEEVLKNSVGREPNGEPINEILFSVVSWQGRNFLYIGQFIEDNWQGDSRIAECVNGDYKKRYGNIRGWLKFIMKRTNKRLDNIQNQINSLGDERDELYSLKYKIEEVL